MLRVTTRQGNIMIFTKLKDTFKNFASNRKGNVAITFGLSMIPIIFSVGAAVDYSRYSQGFNRMVSAGDTAILAASKFMTHSGIDDDQELQEGLEEQFDKFMEANFTKSKYGIDYTYELSYNRDDNTVSVEIDGEQQTAFLKAVGIDALVFNETLGTRLEITPENYVIDIVMCIDATGSMQNTLDAVQSNAATFNTQLRNELNIEENDERFKIRIRPIYYRDYEDALAYTGWATTTVPGNGYIRLNGGWSWGYHEGVHLEWDYNPYDITRGIKTATDFYDLDDPAAASNFQSFLDSEMAWGGGNLPEASGACMNEGMRSDWYDREETDDFPDDENLTVFPIIVVWTDAAIRTLSVTQQISPTQPTSYNSFEEQWGSSVLPQDPKLMILFGPENYSGWSTVKDWNNYAYGGPLSTGNSDAISVIADNIIKTLPDVLRLTH